MNPLFKTLKHAVNAFCQTIRAGYYTPVTRATLHQDADSDALPKSSEVTAGLGAFSVAYAIATDIVLGVAVAASASFVAAGAAAFALAGAGIMTAVYFRCKRTAAQKISERNMAGQKVTGDRGDLCALHRAQKRIVSLAMDFNEVAPPAIVNAEIQSIVAQTKPQRDCVRVCDAGGCVGDKHSYQFVVPVVGLRAATEVFKPSQHRKTVQQRPASHGATKHPPKAA